MDRFFLFLLGTMAAALIASLSVFFMRRGAVEPTPAVQTPAVKAETPVASVRRPWSSPPGAETPMAVPMAMLTPIPWTIPPNPGTTATVTYPGFTVVYSVTLGNPLAVQYALVQGAKPRRYPPPAKVRTPDAALIPAASFARGPIAFPKSITLYFGKAAGGNTGLMPNVCAFYPACLRGPWTRLAELELRYASEFKWIEVVSGPIFANPPVQTGGIVIPSAFYRVYRRSFGDCIAFIVPQTATSTAMEGYLTSIASVEAATGMAIFANTISEQDRAETAKAIW
ncbi:MAG: DNA/RNA non-specific endonuclease [Terrimicrobiaceae bacterium]|nr:DNA/RNA non-specific endonuclease [Terrimicrobiaceae bacterium]